MISESIDSSKKKNEILRRGNERLEAKVADLERMIGSQTVKGIDGVEMIMQPKKISAYRGMGRDGKERLIAKLGDDNTPYMVLMSNVSDVVNGIKKSFYFQRVEE